MRIQTFEEWYHYKFGDDYVFEGHTHAETYEINVILSGNMEIVVGDRIIEAESGRIVLISPNVFHRNRAISNGTEMLVLQFSVGRADLCLGDMFTRTLDEVELSLARLLLRELERSHKYHGSCRLEDDRAGICFELLDSLLEIAISYRSDATSVQSHDASLYGEAVRYMERHICEKLSISDIARAVGASPSALKKLFAEISGGGVIEYFGKMKIGRAKVMLEEGNSALYVSQYLGFSSQSYFTSRFKRITGETPARLRRSHASRNKRG